MLDLKTIGSKSISGKSREGYFGQSPHFSKARGLHNVTPGPPHWPVLCRATFIWHRLEDLLCHPLFSHRHQSMERAWALKLEDLSSSPWQHHLTKWPWVRGLISQNHTVPHACDGSSASQYLPAMFWDLKWGYRYEKSLKVLKHYSAPTLIFINVDSTGLWWWRLAVMWPNACKENCDVLLAE